MGVGDHVAVALRSASGEIVPVSGAEETSDMVQHVAVVASLIKAFEAHHQLDLRQPSVGDRRMRVSAGDKPCEALIVNRDNY